MASITRNKGEDDHVKNLVDDFIQDCRGWGIIVSHELIISEGIGALGKRYKDMSNNDRVAVSPPAPLDEEIAKPETAEGE